MKANPKLNRSLNTQQAYDHEVEKNIKLAVELHRKTLECEKICSKYSDLERNMVKLESETKNLLQEAKGVIDVTTEENARLKELVARLTNQNSGAFSETNALSELNEKLSKEIHKNRAVEKEVLRMKEEMKVLIAECTAKDYKIMVLQKQIEDKSACLAELQAKFSEREKNAKPAPSKERQAKCFKQIEQTFFSLQSGIFHLSQEGTIESMKTTRKIQALQKQIEKIGNKLAALREALELEGEEANQLGHNQSRRTLVRCASRTSSVETPPRLTPRSQEAEHQTSDTFRERNRLRSSSSVRPQEGLADATNKGTTPQRPSVRKQASNHSREKSPATNERPESKSRDVSKENLKRSVSKIEGSSAEKNKKISRDRSRSQSEKNIKPQKQSPNRDKSRSYTTQEDIPAHPVEGKENTAANSKKKPPAVKARKQEPAKSKSPATKDSKKKPYTFLKTNLTIEIPETEYSFAHLPNGERIAYLDASPADPARTLIVLHGHLGSSIIFRNLMEVLSQYIRIIAIDLRGFGKSTNYKEVKNISEFAEDIKYLIENLQVKNAAIMGVSLGAGVALNFACQYPSLVDRVIMLGTMGLRGWDQEDKEFTYEEIANSEGFSKLLAEAQAKNHAYFERILQPYAWLLSTNKFKELCKESMDYAAIKRAIGLIASADLAENLEKLTAKVLIIHGQKDNVFPKELAEDAADEIGENALLEIWKENGEMLLAEVPEKVADTVGLFVMT